MPKLSKPQIEIRSGPGGESAYIAGTRVRVSDIARMYSIAEDEVVADAIRKALPHLSLEQILAAIEYWRSHQAEVEAEAREEEALLRRLASEHR